MHLVIRSNYSDDAIALVAFAAANPKFFERFDCIYVVYIDTSWAAKEWEARVALGEAFVKACGFVPIRLHSGTSFDELVCLQGRFPSAKFQWCANFLKGLPLLKWLDEHDMAVDCEIALAKRQEDYRITIPEYRRECPYHGERDVWHPIRSMSVTERDRLLNDAGFEQKYRRSLECAPCIHDTKAQFLALEQEDQEKMRQLAGKMSIPLHFRTASVTEKPRDVFTLGCGDFFGCGL